MAVKTDKKTGNDELKRIEATHGPFRGSHIDIPAADADQAIGEGWAKDPFAPLDPKAEPLEFDQDQHDAATLAAEKYARKLRGEAEPAAAETAAEKPAAEASTSSRRSRSRE